MKSVLQKRSYSLLLLLVLFCSQVIFSQATTVLRDTQFLENPNESSPLIGVLAGGTVIDSKGEQQDAYVLIEVTVNKRSKQGWILKNDIFDLSGKLNLEKTETEPKVVQKPKRVKDVVPQDEFLSDRHSSYRYGLIAQGAYSITTLDADGASYGGLGFGGGAFFQVYIMPSFLIGIEADFTFHRASLSTFYDRDLSLGIAEFWATAEWDFISRTLGLWLGAGYGAGTMLGDAPARSGILQSSDVSDVKAGAGLLYHFSRSSLMGGYTGVRGTTGFSTFPARLIQIQWVLSINIEG